MRILRLVLILAAWNLAPAQDSHGADVRKFGAQGDGVANDTDAVRKALESGSVIFPQGVYRFTETVVIDLAKTGPVSLTGEGAARIVMAGPGPAFRFVGTHTGSAE